MTPPRTFQPAARPTIEEHELVFYRMCQAAAHELDVEGSMNVDKWNELFSESRAYVQAHGGNAPFDQG